MMTGQQDCDGWNIYDAFSAFGIPGNPTLLFAFKHAEVLWGMMTGQQDCDGWNIYDPMQEYARLGADTVKVPSPQCPWRVMDLNAQYELCSTYPSILALPRAMSEHDIKAVAGFRKRGRLPVMSWCGGAELNFASLWRCAQTTEGLMGKQCYEDQKMVNCIRTGAQLP